MKRLELVYERKSEEIRHALNFIRERSYVARALMPDGYERYFQEHARYLSAHTSTAIEGNPLGRTRAMIVLIEGADPENPAEVEKVNLEEAYEMIDWLSQDPTTKIDQGIIRTLNSMALKNLPDVKARRRGMYRIGPAVIVDSDTREIKYRPPEAEILADVMDGLTTSIERWRHEEPGPVAAALAHFGLISVHPFEDGNGRTARVVADMLLNVTGWSVTGALSANMVILEQRKEYYNVLRAVQGEEYQDKLDVTEFVRFHCQALSDAAIDLEAKVVSFNQRRDLMFEAGNGVLNPRQVTALMFMQDLGPLSTSMYAKVTSSSQSSARVDLTEMIDQELVVREGAGPSTRYKLAERVWELLEKVRKASETQDVPLPATEVPGLEPAETPQG